MNLDDFNLEEFDENFIENLKEQAQSFVPENEEDYEIDPKNYTKIIFILTLLLKRICNSDYDFVYPVEMKPSEKNVSVEVDFVGLTLKNKMVSEFKTLFDLSDMVGIDVVNDKLHFEFVVKNVYKKKT